MFVCVCRGRGGGGDRYIMASTIFVNDVIFANIKQFRYIRKYKLLELVRNYSKMIH